MGEQVSGKLIKDLEQRHEFVSQRVQRFAEIANADSIRLPIRCFFETQPTNIARKILPQRLASFARSHSQVVSRPIGASVLHIY
jgi:hypothetical protein